METIYFLFTFQVLENVRKVKFKSKILSRYHFHGKRVSNRRVGRVGLNATKF